MLHKNYTPEESEPAQIRQEEQPEKPEQAASGSQIPKKQEEEEGPDRPEQGPAIPPQEQTRGIP